MNKCRLRKDIPIAPRESRGSEYDDATPAATRIPQDNLAGDTYVVSAFLSSHQYYFQVCLFGGGTSHRVPEEELSCTFFDFDDLKILVDEDQWRTGRGESYWSVFIHGTKR